ncbi:MULTISPECIES: VgrG-related protein [unclassified Nostoc]|uniref:VgrG-related protein n=1 Tax=unclassified Nostoc TaxID=2593658 RepID=UPI002AD5573B|nr:MULTISPECIES: VgrG-related protein [unclassified Nostoc]MDZ8122504.1 VgrG-related protein [Nostoc sp. CmiVER01]MDZ8221681.1 VgrG-related protein [Nostoc sp. ChiVER01]
MPTKNSQTLYLHKPILKLGGAKAPEKLMQDILEIVVDESLHLPSMFIIKIHNVYVAASEDSEPWKNEKYFNIGDPISIGFEASTTEDLDFQVAEIEDRLIEGEITGIEVKFSHTSEAHIIVHGYDVSHRLHRGRYNRSFLNSTDTDIVRRIAQEAKIKIGQLDASGVSHEYVFQENQTNMEFLRERAAKIGFELFVQDNKIHFCKPKSDGSLKLDWLEDITSFDVKVTSAEQVSSVQVNSWDYGNKKLISETISKEQLLTETGNGDGSSISQKFKMKQPPKMIVVDQPVDTSKEAKQMAQSLCNELSGEFVTADAKAMGNPMIRPGKVVTLKNMGTRYSGKYYVTGTCHRYIHRNYTTNFTVRGLREGSLLSILPPKTHLQPGQTLLVGLVTNNNDPKGWGRVKVKFPTLTMNDESHWARVVGLGAGNDRGFYCLPEIDDEVLVAFEHGDIHRPYIIGGVWNGKDKTVETVDDTIQNGQVRLRTIKTRAGHIVRFVDDDKGTENRGYYVQTATGSGHRLSFNDTQKFIETQTAQGQTVTLNDIDGSINVKANRTINNTAPLSIDLESATITNTAQAIAIDAGEAIAIDAGGAITINAGGAITIDAIGAVTINSPNIMLNGIVYVQGVPI